MIPLPTYEKQASEMLQQNITAGIISLIIGSAMNNLKMAATSNNLNETYKRYICGGSRI